MVKFGIMNQATTTWEVTKVTRNMKKDILKARPCLGFNNRAALAQLVEQLICNQ